MPNNKRQHYVPKFMLRRFSSDAEGKQISIINKRSKRLITNASLRDQCYRDNFYGDTEIEREIAKLEGSFAEIIDTIISSESIHLRDTQNICTMIMLQMVRTLRSEEQMNEMTDKLV